MKYQIFRKVNANAHNVRYGRDCHAPAVACGVVEAADEYAARDEAERLGLVYCPDAGQYEYLFDRAEPVARAEDERWNWNWLQQMADARATAHGGLVRTETGQNGQAREVFNSGAVYNHCHRIGTTHYRDYWEGID